MRLPVVKPLTLNARSYDLFVAALGYEERARAAAEQLSSNSVIKYASAFGDRKELSYAENAQWMTDHGFVIEEARSDREFAANIDNALAALGEEDVPKICVDISSMTRARIAIVVEALASDLRGRLYVVDFVYSLGRFNPPPGDRVPNLHVGPVSPAFAGWWSEPERGVAAIVGLGYEQDQALGAIQHVEAADAWAMLPSSREAAYEEAVLEANRTLLDFIPRSRRGTYVVEHPFESFVALESLVEATSRHSNVVIFPFGPKIFCLLSLLVASLHSDVAVWRVSAGGADKALQRYASGVLTGVQVLWQKAVEESGSGPPFSGVEQL